ncbi:MAG: hypothetical protein KDD36_09280 [Flavobacteriales bacterium]|nr:hypothetical protein [Flavobacteriales bacterium]
MEMIKADMCERGVARYHMTDNVVSKPRRIQVGANEVVYVCFCHIKLPNTFSLTLLSGTSKVVYTPFTMRLTEGCSISATIVAVAQAQATSEAQAEAIASLFGGGPEASASASTQSQAQAQSQAEIESDNSDEAYNESSLISRHWSDVIIKQVGGAGEDGLDFFLRYVRVKFDHNDIPCAPKC